MNRVSVWKIGKFYYLWLDNFNSYFMYCYKYKRGALIAAENLTEPPVILPGQTFKNYTECIGADFKG